MRTLTLIFFSFVKLGLVAFAQQPSVFDGYLALVEISSVEKLDPSQAKGYVVKKDLVHNAVGKVIDVYDGPDNIISSLFPLTPPPYLEGRPDALTHTLVAFEGVIPEKNLPVGAKAVLTLLPRKSFDPMKHNFNPYRFPDRSIFFALLAKPGFTFDKVLPEFFSIQKDWAEAIKQFNTIEDDKYRIAYLKQAIRSENPLLAVTAVHLLKRFYPPEAEKYFDEIILAPGVPVYARLAMDHEFCLSRGQAWVNGKQKELEPILEKEAPEVPEGTGLLSFRKQMIDNGSWFGGRGERE